MRIAELSQRTQVPMPTIKYYLREGLLHPGQLTSRNQATYDESHVRRLRLVRALVEVGKLPITATRELFTRMQGQTLFDALGKAQYALTRISGAAESVEHLSAEPDVDALIARRGWRIKATNPARRELAAVMATLHSLEQSDFLTLLDDYAAAAEHLATAEVRLIQQRPHIESMLEGVVTGTVLSDVLFAALRRLAQENEAATAFRPRVKTASRGPTRKRK
ncbi:MAG TPA: MerR family transcriptional regulator [Polyangiaceae bacterium]|nr:MerR family transcriptional regulator [Polyangiaceae bacterium]